MFFKLSKELILSQNEKIQDKKPITCYSMDIIHNTKMFYTMLFTTKEAAQERAQKHAEENSRLKARYIVTDGILQDQCFTSGYNSTMRIDGAKTGKVIQWSVTA